MWPQFIKRRCTFSKKQKTVQIEQQFCALMEEISRLDKIKLFGVFVHQIRHNIKIISNHMKCDTVLYQIYSNYNNFF